MEQGCTSTRRGSDSGSGMAPASDMAGTSEGIALAAGVALAEDMAEAVRVVSAEAMAEGIDSSGSPQSIVLLEQRFLRGQYIGRIYHHGLYVCSTLWRRQREPPLLHS